MSCVLFSFVLIGGVIAIYLNGENNSSKYMNYPTGYELKRELRKIVIYNHDIYNLNFELIEESIFRDYVYDFEINHGYTRESALRRALDKYIEVYKIGRE